MDDYRLIASGIGFISLTVPIVYWEKLHIKDPVCREISETRSKSIKE